MMDFEPAMQNAIKKNFEDFKIGGCYFHFVKLLQGKAKKLNLCSKDKMFNTHIIKFYPFVFW